MSSVSKTCVTGLILIGFILVCILHEHEAAVFESRPRSKNSTKTRDGKLEEGPLLFRPSARTFHSSECDRFFIKNGQPSLTGIAANKRSICHISQKGQLLFGFAAQHDVIRKIPDWSAFRITQIDTTERRSTYFKQDGSLNPKESQASNADYTRSGFNKGHLIAFSYQPPDKEASITNLYTNAAPQYPSFNQHIWYPKGEHLLKKYAKDECLAKGGEMYVVVGTQGEINHIGNRHVTVPKYFWTAACCLMKDKVASFAYYGENKEKDSSVLDVSVSQLQTILKGMNYEINIFPGDGNCASSKNNVDVYP